MIDVPGLPDGLTARPPTLDDIDEVVALCRAEQVRSGVEAHTNAADFTSEWQRPSMDLDLDAVVVQEGPRIVGYADQSDGRAWVAVDPSAEGRGIGTALRHWTEANARHHGLPRIGQTLPRTATEAMSLLADAGWTARWDTWVFSIPLGPDLPAPHLPDGVVVRSIRRPDEERAVYDVVQGAFGEWPDRDSSQTFEDWRAENLDRDDADADLLLVAVEDDRVVGAALCLEDEDEGWVAELAVPREHRGRGLGRGLLESAFQRFAARGRLTAGLSTDSRTGARTLYEHVGMTVTEDWARWAMDLD